MTNKVPSMRVPSNMGRRADAAIAVAEIRSLLDRASTDQAIDFFEHAGQADDVVWTVFSNGCRRKLGTIEVRRPTLSYSVGIRSAAINAGNVEQVYGLGLERELRAICRANGLIPGTTNEIEEAEQIVGGFQTLEP